MSATTEQTIPRPQVTSQDEWVTARKDFLKKEKEMTKAMDRLNAERRRLPMVKVEKDYVFDSPEGKKSLLDLFENRRQLIIYHFMFGPDWEKGCAGCTGMVDALGDLSMLNDRDTTYVLVSRAPLPKLEAYKAQHGWDKTWVSSFGSDFNYDYHVTLDDKVTPAEYNYKSKEELIESGWKSDDINGEHHGLSVFFRVGDEVYHTYSTYGRGCENITDSYQLLDLTPYGRQEDFEDSPAGWPQKPTYG